MKANLFVAVSLLTGCAVDADTDSVEQHTALHTILLPAGGTGQNRVVMNAFEPLVVTLSHVDGVPIGGQMITFTSPAGGATAALPFDGMAETDSEGRAELRPTANRRTGTYLVWAHADGAEPMPFVLTNRAGAPTTVLPILGRNQATYFGAAFEQPLTVEVQDFYSNRVEDAEVEFVAPSSGPSARVSDRTRVTTVTDDEGRASVFAVANGEPGMYTVIAMVVGATNEVPFVLSNLDPADSSWRRQVVQNATADSYEQPGTATIVTH